jgi:hypothetical protein
MNRNWALVLSLLGALCVLLAACQPPEPVVMSELPLYPGTQPLATGENATADEVLSLLESALEESTDEGVTIESELYTLPQGESWERVRNYYEGQLANTAWKPASEMEQEGDNFRSAGWARGRGDGEQAFAVIHVTGVLEEDLLVTFLVSE